MLHHLNIFNRGRSVNNLASWIDASVHASILLTRVDSASVAKVRLIVLNCR